MKQSKNFEQRALFLLQDMSPMLKYLIQVEEHLAAGNKIETLPPELHKPANNLILCCLNFCIAMILEGNVRVIETKNN